MPSLVSVVEPGRRRPRGFAVVDVEATGSSSRRNRVLELAVVLLDQDLAAEGEFATLVDPQGPVGPTHVHGIAPDQVAGAPLFAGIAARLAGLLRGRVLVGHNVGCDRAFLAAEYARIGVLMPAVPEVCTMRLAAQVLWPGVQVPRGLSLQACAAAVGVTGWRQHTALGDARATAALFTRLAPGMSDLPACLVRAAAVAWPEPSGAWLGAAGVRAGSSGAPAAADALWMRRGTAPAPRGGDPARGGGGVPAPHGNDSARRSVPDARRGSA